ncbi:hypothetical protein BN3661_00380 [Eubacteriaceae bacterium CHKCI005]|nr:hypothetical protein BN3661_00380 [Eubacteriaceae bacterium CHKCI005]
MKGKHAKKKEWDRTVRRMLSIIPVLVVALSVYTMSALAWFSSSVVEKPMEIASGQYVSQVEIVKEETGLINDDNLIGESHKTSSFLNENIDLSGLGTTQTAYIIVSNYNENQSDPGTIADADVDNSTHNIPFQYELELKAGGSSVNIKRVDGNSEGTPVQEGTTDSVVKCESLDPGKRDIYQVTFTEEQLKNLGDVQLQLRTAFTGSAIYHASSLDDLTQTEYAPGSVVYLMNNIEEPEAELTFDQGSYPNLVLNNYLLKVGNLTVEADEGVYSTMDISGGVLDVGGKVYDSAKDTIESVGEGRITVNLLDLKEEYRKDGADDDAQALDQLEVQENEVQQPAEENPSISDSSVPSAPVKDQAPSTSKPSEKPSVSSSRPASSSSSTSASTAPSVSSPDKESSSAKPADNSSAPSSSPPVEPDRTGQQDVAIVEKTTMG